MTTAKKFPDHVDVELSRPLEVDGAKVDKLRVREPTVGDQIAASESAGSDAAKEVALFANLCELAPGDIQRLPLRDYQRLQEAYAGFTDQAP